MASGARYSDALLDDRLSLSPSAMAAGIRGVPGGVGRVEAIRVGPEGRVRAQCRLPGERVRVCVRVCELAGER